MKEHSEEQLEAQHINNKAIGNLKQEISTLNAKIDNFE